MIRRAGDHSDFLRRGELADEEERERAEAADSEGTLRRRDFLARTAAAAGGASLASLLPAEQLVAAAAKAKGGRGHLPKPRNIPIDTVVVLMMENRSFDHYFGWHPKADAKNTGLSYPDVNGNPVETHHLTNDFQGCEFRDPDHGWNGGRHQYNGGKLDGFVTGNDEGDGSDSFAAGYYLRDDLGFIPSVANAYTLYDRWFCSLMASTYPNRHYQWGAQNGGQKSNKFPNPATEADGFTWETIFDRAQTKGVSVGYYNSDLPFSALYGTRGLSWTKPIASYYQQAADGTLPNICFVDPPFKDGGGGDGTSADEHPHGDIRLGQAFMSDVVHAFMESPQYKRGVLFINYDEWGGFFDHVRPHFVPDDRQSTDLYENWGMTGFRIPGVAVSPFTRNGGVSHQPVTHESILKLISYRFGLGYLNKRHRYASNIGRSFHWKRHKTDPPKLPDPVAIASIPCSLQQSQGTLRPKPHDLVGLETSGLLDRLGYEVKPARYDQIFRSPDSVSKALRESTRYSR
jgi:phospholipase C